MYERAMGQNFSRLATVVQRFHRLSGLHVLHGQVEADAPRSLSGKLLALFLGTPRQAFSGAIRFELDASPTAETWTRYFPGRTMTSRLHICSGKVVEHLGAARLTFDLVESAGRLEMRLMRLRFLGIPCPNWLMPQLVAQETEHGDLLQFRVQAALPLVGVVASYRGHLTVPAQESP